MSNDKQQSAVEWIFDHMVGLAEDYDDGKINYTQYCDGVKEILQQAKAMHKEEMINVWIDAYTTNMKRPTRDNFILWAENYYNETYGGNK